MTEATALTIRLHAADNVVVARGDNMICFTTGRGSRGFG